MSELPKLTVEIFRDADSNPSSLADIEAAVGYIGLVTGDGVVLQDSGRRLDIGTARRSYINMKAVRWPKFCADVNLVASNYPIFDPDDGVNVVLADRLQYANESSVLGLSYPSARVAMIDTLKRPEMTSQTASHELGHLFGLKKRGVTWDGSDHCTTDLCLMTPQVTRSTKEVLVAGTGIRAVFERRGWKQPERKTVISRNAGFCGECDDQLGQRVLLRRQIKARMNAMDKSLE